MVALAWWDCCGVLRGCVCRLSILAKDGTQETGRQSFPPCAIFSACCMHRPITAMWSTASRIALFQYTVFSVASCWYSSSHFRLWQVRSWRLECSFTLDLVYRLETNDVGRGRGFGSCCSATPSITCAGPGETIKSLSGGWPTGVIPSHKQGSAKLEGFALFSRSRRTSPTVNIVPPTGRLASDFGTLVPTPIIPL